MRTLYFCPVVSFYLLFLLLASSQRPQIGCLPYFHTWRGPSANLECRSEICCTRLAGNTGRKNDAKKSPSAHHRTTLSGYIFATKERIDNRKKNLLSSNISPTSPCNMVNFGPLADDIVSLVWGNPANFNGFRVLAALLHSQTAASNRGRHLYPAGRHHARHWPTFLVLSFFLLFSSPNLSGRRLEVYHTCRHGVALVRI